MRLGGDRVLIIAQLVGGIGQRLDQRDLDARGIGRHRRTERDRQMIEQQLAEAGVVARQIGWRVGGPAGCRIRAHGPLTRICRTCPAATSR